MRMYASAASIVLLLSILFAEIATAAGPDPIGGAVSQHFAAKKDHKPGNLITQGDFDAVMDTLKKKDVDIKRFAPVRNRIPASTSYLQRLNTSKSGSKFLRKVARTPGGYGSIEDLASRPGGEKAMRKITTAKDGEKLIEYMSTTRGGKQLLKMTPGRTRKPAAERVYTAEQLLRALKSAKPRDAKKAGN